MSTIGTGPSSATLSVFISAASSEFRADRDALASLLAE